MGKIVAVITVDDNICGSCPLRECNRCMYFHKQLHKNIEAGYLRCVTCKQAEVREPKAEVKECVWTFIQVYETKGSVKKIFQTSCHKEVMNNGDNMYCRHCGGKIKEAK